jgi:hypothetical protein
MVHLASIFDRLASSSNPHAPFLGRCLITELALRPVGREIFIMLKALPTADIDYTLRGTYHLGISNGMHLLGLHVNANLLLKDLLASALDVHRNCITLLWWIYGDVDKSLSNT